MSIRSTDAKTLLKQAGAAIRVLSTENQTLKDKLASQEKTARVVKIAKEMEAKGLSPDLEFEDKVAALNSAGNLDVTEQAVKLATPQGLNLVRLGETSEHGGSGNALETFIMTGESPE